ncbi:MAG: hypothetical protein JWQ62_686 [Lacunisphaera sp.]|nr:hypothetical protein [Lacunisphaera sp.]
MHISSLHLYPVKSCRGLSVASAEADDFGFIGDRRFMVVTEAEGMFLTQRAHPHMALIETALTRDSLILSSAKHGQVSIPLNASHGQRRVTVWKSTVNADDCGDEPAEWLSDFLGGSLRLVRMGGTYQRQMTKAAAQPGDVVSFADAEPFLVVSEASLADLNARLAVKGQPALPMNRFRPNLVVAGCEPYAEDHWDRVAIGTMVFRNGGLCARCPITTTDQFTALRGKEPLKTFATYRRDKDQPTNVNFGTNLIHETKRGRVQVGDAVLPL